MNSNGEEVKYLRSCSPPAHVLINIHYLRQSPVVRWNRLVCSLSLYHDAAFLTRLFHISTGPNSGGRSVEEKQRKKTRGWLNLLCIKSFWTETDTNSDPDLLEPHILRSLSNVKVQSIHTSCISCHVICIDTDGAAWLFGRNERSTLGVSNEEVISENAPRQLLATELGAEYGTKFVHAACGRNHSLLVGSNGQVWSAGKNDVGQVSGFNLSVHTLFNQNPLVRPFRMPRSSSF